MVKLTAPLMAFLLLGVMHSAHACLCSPASTKWLFPEMASRSEFVVRARVESHDDRLGAGPSSFGQSMTISIVSTLKGDATPS
jgi:hypothetical protein